MALDSLTEWDGLISNGVAVDVRSGPPRRPRVGYTMFAASDDFSRFLVVGDQRPVFDLAGQCCRDAGAAEELAAGIASIKCPADALDGEHCVDRIISSRMEVSNR